jgi:hypothetical protein
VLPKNERDITKCTTHLICILQKISTIYLPIIQSNSQQYSLWEKKIWCLPMTAPTMHPVLHFDLFTGHESTVYREKLPAMYSNVFFFFWCSVQKIAEQGEAAGNVFECIRIILISVQKIAQQNNYCIFSPLFFLWIRKQSVQGEAAGIYSFLCLSYFCDMFLVLT